MDGEAAPCERSDSVAAHKLLALEIEREGHIEKQFKISVLPLAGEAGCASTVVSNRRAGSAGCEPEHVHTCVQ